MEIMLIPLPSSVIVDAQIPKRFDVVVYGASAILYPKHGYLPDGMQFPWPNKTNGGSTTA